MVAQRALTGFEHILLGLVVTRPRSGYELKSFFSRTPAMVYEPSSGTLYPGLRRLEARGLLEGERESSAGRRLRLVYRATPAGEEAHRQWLSAPIEAGTVGRDLGLHLMRFAMAEALLPREAVVKLVSDLADALDAFVADMERFTATAQLPGRHARLAVQHGIDVHRASLRWARSTIATLSEPDGQR